MIAGVALVILAAMPGCADGGDVPAPRAGWATSRPCVMCHPDHDASWRRTFHRTMTQRPTELSVLGDFSGATYTHDGVTSRFRRDGARFVIETLDPETRTMRAFDVAMTVGSRRFQQYVTKIGDRHVRLPLAWNVEERRWFHLSAGFLHPDGSDFHAHTALWDGNCIFCHNTGPKPGYDPERGTYASEVVELGIACEACHAPGAEHVRATKSPLRRYALYLSDGGDPSIVAPRELDKSRSLDVCGRCHGQRIPEPMERILQYLRDGDPFAPGASLRTYVRPIERSSTLPGVDLSLRFWGDGTPRLTAYEYQGLLLSKDHQRGDLVCTSCHVMHGGDPRGMIEPKMRGPAACAPCHAALVADPAPHTRHDATSTGSDCYACHMPKIVYGLVAVHRSHRITSPEPARAWRASMPDACVLCHVDRTARWAASERARLWDDPRPEEPTDLSQGTGWDHAETIRALFAGDVVERAVAAAALAEERSYTGDARARLWAVPLLVIAMEDRYPALRHFAYRSAVALVRRTGDAALLAGLEALPPFDPGGPAEARARAVEAWRAWWRAVDRRGIPHPGPAVPLDDALSPIAARIEPLLAAQPAEIIAIGE
ncbi:hypothetical protein L6R52_20915 [Myxococcota bacterium]|nr:hypothetical protein [Myxococcota bacterium]